MRTYASLSAPEGRAKVYDTHLEGHDQNPQAHGPSIRREGVKVLRHGHDGEAKNLRANAVGSEVEGTGGIRGARWRSSVKQSSRSGLPPSRVSRLWVLVGVVCHVDRVFSRARQWLGSSNVLPRTDCVGTCANGRRSHLE